MSYLEPGYPLLLCLAVVALVRSWRGAPMNNKPWLMAFSVLGLVLLSMNLVAWLVSRPLEMWDDQAPIPDASAQAIVVLAGAVDPPRPSRPYAVAAQDTYLRVQPAAWVFKNWR